MPITFTRSLKGDLVEYMKKVNNREKIPLYVIFKCKVDGKEYAIQRKYKKNLDKYVEWYGKLKNAPPDIMVPGFPVIYHRENGMLDVDSSTLFILRVKDLEPTWVNIVKD